MTGSRVFVDTAPFIYLVEEHPKYHEKVVLFFADCIRQNTGLVTSVLTVAEFQVKPLKVKNFQVIKIFEKIIHSAFEVQEIDWKVATLSAEIRVKYPSVRGFDSLQLACAIHLNCDFFITNDKKLKSVKDISIRLIEEL
jgi:predicted nucleic acid-binding protein